MAGSDRLSDLPDDLLRRVLGFTPAKEAASTSALSWRWRSLWRSSGAVNLEARPYERANSYAYPTSDEEARFFSQRGAFVSAAEAALAGTVGPLTRLTFHVQARDEKPISQFLYREVDWAKRCDVIADVLSHPAARCLRELQLGVCTDGRFYDGDDEICSLLYPRLHTQLNLGSLPSDTLRVLELANFDELNCYFEDEESTPSPPVAVTFPRLASLRLRRCGVPLEDLQGIIDAAPQLAVLHLECVDLAEATPSSEECLLRCPAATELVLDNCGWTHMAERRSYIALEVDAPRLRLFRYKGFVRKFSLISQPPDLARADLHFLHDRYQDDNSPIRENFWRFVRCFSNAKELKLRVNNLEDIAVVREAKRADLLCVFRSLERLELEGKHSAKGRTAAVAIGNLLQCCHMLRDLRIKLGSPSSVVVEYDDVDRSIVGFMRRKRKLMDSTEANDDGIEDVPVIVPGLSDLSFDCLQRTLTRVGLQFEWADSNCIGVKLVKFFAENAKVLEQMCIDVGNRKLSEHINPKVARWIENSSKRKRSSTPVAVLPFIR